MTLCNRKLKLNKTYQIRPAGQHFIIIFFSIIVLSTGNITDCICVNLISMHIMLHILNMLYRKPI